MSFHSSRIVAGYVDFDHLAPNYSLNKSNLLLCIGMLWLIGFFVVYVLRAWASLKRRVLCASSQQVSMCPISVNFVVIRSNMCVLWPFWGRFQPLSLQPRGALQPSFSCTWSSVSHGRQAISLPLPDGVTVLSSKDAKYVKPESMISIPRDAGAPSVVSYERKFLEQISTSEC